MQHAPAAPVPAFAGAMPVSPQTSTAAVLPQAQASPHPPALPQIPNNQALYASAPAAMPPQGVVSQMVPHDPSQYQPMPANPSMGAPVMPVAGQTDLNGSGSVSYPVPAMQPIVSVIEYTSH